MGKSSPKAPAPPDPYATAQAQGQMNKETAIANAYLNRINQYSPQGSLEFQQIGTNPDGTPQFASYQTYSPEQQQLYQQQTAVSNALSGLAGSNIQRVAEAQSTPFSYAGMQPLQTSVAQGPIATGTGYNQGVNYSFNTGNPVQSQIAGAGDVQRSYGPTGNIQTGLGDAGQIQDQIAGAGDVSRSFGDAGNLQRGLDFSRAPNLPGVNDFSADAQRVNDAVYKQATSRLDPAFEQQQRQLATQLASKGVTENSEAYRRAMDQFARQRTDAYNQATYSGIQAGAQEQSRLFGLGLQARQQNVGETQAQGQFANQAQAQAYEQALGRGQFGNQAQQQQFAQNAAAMQAANAAQNQRFSQNVAGGQFANEAQRQQYEQALGGMEALNAAQQQQFGQNQAQAAFGNQAQQQQYEQNMGAASFGNEAQQQGYQQAMGNAAFGNQAQQQQYQQDAANAAFGNQARQQQIAEAAYLRNMPLNDIAALLGTGGGVQNPAFADYQAVNQAGVDYAGLVQNNFNNKMSIYQQQQAARNQGLGSLFGLAGSAAMAFSDRRLKTGIKAIGKLASGLTTYTFRYLRNPAIQFGVMADEVFKVFPDAVAVDPSGYLTVDYGKVW